MASFNELVEEIQKHLDCTHQNWFFGAGISYKSNIPLMIPLTRKIKVEILKGVGKELFLCIEKQLPDNAHIEHFLSHIGDLLALLQRSKSGIIKLDTTEFTIDNLTDLYKEIVSIIGNIMRYGYREATTTETELVGTIDKPIVEINYHRHFLKKLFKTRANLERLTKINFFTINYDTLLEDALVLEKKWITDGFTGGTMGYWNPEEFDVKGNKFKVIKLHGSVDWYKDNDIGLTRCRYGTKYLSDNSNILIYPQATKYVETQKDPFATLFHQFRSDLQISSDNILVSCGYSFGDEHINSEMELALASSNSNRHALLFVKENYDEVKKEYFLNPILKRWLNKSLIKERIFVITNRGLYNGDDNLLRDKTGGDDYDWWTFEGLTNFIG